METNMKRTLTVATMIALGAAAFAPLPSMAQTDFRVVIGSAPPPPMYERAPAPRHGYVWAPGYWQWSGHRHNWVQGQWLAARQGYAYASPSWHQRDGRWYMEPGRWNTYGPDRGRVAFYDRDRDGVPDRYDRHIGYRGDGYRGDGYRGDGYRGDGYRGDGYRGRGRGDFDRDGVPNRYDHDLDNDGISNRHDRDRDGDGVRNGRDARPDNPYRN
jgi:hypothetical protein